MIKVRLDPGHAKKYNQGYYSEYYESEANWAVCQKVKKIAEKTGFFKVDLTKTSLNHDPSLATRGKLAKGYHLFHSVHSNAYLKTSSGCFVIESTKLVNWEFARILATYISTALNVPDLGVRNRSYTSGLSSSAEKGTDYYGVIRNAVAVGCPKVLLSEALFHSNPKECKIRMSSEGQEKEARAIVDAWIKIFNLKIPIVNEIKYWKDILKASKLDNSKLWIKYFENLVELASVEDAGFLNMSIHLPTLIEKVYANASKENKNFEDILKSSKLSSYIAWKDYFDKLIQLAKGKNDIGFLEKSIYIPTLLEKIHNNKK